MAPAPIRHKARGRHPEVRHSVANMVSPGQDSKLDPTTLGVLMIIGGVVLAFLGYLLVDFLRSKSELRRLARKRRAAQQAWEREQKEMEEE